MSGEETVRKYLESSDVACPFCGSKKADSFDTETGDVEVRQDWHCGDCEKQWTLTYTLTSFESNDTGTVHTNVHLPMRKEGEG